MSTASILRDADIFAEVVRSDQTTFEPEMARPVLRMHFSEAQNEQLRELADKGNRGTLSDDDQELVESFRRVGNFLALLQSRARLELQSPDSSS